MIKLKELFDTPAVDVKKTDAEPWEEESQISYKFSLPSKTGTSLDYRVVFHFISNTQYMLTMYGVSKEDPEIKACSVEFQAKESDSSSAFYSLEAGINAQPFKVFSIVWKIMSDFFKKHNIELFYFSSNKTEKSRVELYKKFSKLIDAKTEWKLLKDEELGAGYVFVFVREDMIQYYK